MILHTVDFTRLKQTSFPLKAWKKPAPPQQTDNPMRTLIEFARFMGITSWPARTTEKLRTDPYFRYCFAPLGLYGAYNELNAETRTRLAFIFQNPDQATDRDLFLGIDKYINNFRGYMPGNYRAEAARKSPGTYEKWERVIAVVDKVLQEKGLGQRAEELQASRTKETKGYAVRAEFLRLCADIFNALVENKSFTAEELWA